MKKFLLIITVFFSIFSFSFSAPEEWAIEQSQWLPQTNQWADTQADVWAVNLASWVEVETKMSNPNNIWTKLWANAWDNINWNDWILTKIIKFARESIFNLLWVIVIWVLLYIWFRLVIWRWTPDIFKKAMMWLVYLVIWVVLIYSAWAMIKIILWFNL